MEFIKKAMSNNGNYNICEGILIVTPSFFHTQFIIDRSCILELNELCTELRINGEVPPVIADQLTYVHIEKGSEISLNSVFSQVPLVLKCLLYQ